MLNYVSNIPNHVWLIFLDKPSFSYERFPECPKYFYPNADWTGPYYILNYNTNNTITKRLGLFVFSLFNLNIFTVDEPT